MKNSQLSLDLGSETKKLAKQLALDLSLPTSFSADDYVVTSSNQTAFNSVLNVSNWSTWAFALTGEKGSGKSHLSAIWAENMGARRISARELDVSSFKSALVTGALLLEDATPSMNSIALFHLLNLIKEEEAYLLITSETPLANWDITPRDALSRLRAIPSAHLEAADDDLLRAVYMKLFADKQLTIDLGVIEALMLNSERSIAAAKANVTRLDKLALEAGKRVSRQMVSLMDSHF